MISKLRSLPLRTFVAAQTNTLQMTDRHEMSSGAVSTRRGRIEMTLGGLFGYAAVAAAPALAAGSTTGKNAPASGVVGVLNSVTNLVIILLAAISLLMGVFAALQFVGSAGNERTISRAKSTIKNVVIGLSLAAGIFIMKKLVIGLFSEANVDSGTGGQNFRDTLLKDQTK